MADYLPVARDIYPVGRLDKDSEGLLILTNDTSLNAALLSPSKKHKRSYFVQLDNDITDKAIKQIAFGVQIKVENGIYTTNSCTVKKLQKPPVLPDRNPPVRFRQNIPTSWALIELTEGKNRQVRKMFASVGFPVLRLVRVQIEDLKIGKLEPGKYYEIKQDELFALLKIDAKELATKKREKLKTIAAKQEEKNPKPATKPTNKPVTRKSAPPKSGYANAPKKSTTERLASKLKEKEEDTTPKPTRKPATRKSAQPKSGYANAPKKSTTDRKESKLKEKGDDKSMQPKKPLSRKPKGSAPWQKFNKKSGNGR